MTDKIKVKPTRVECRRMQDGGALVTANYDYHTLYMEALTDTHAAEKLAASLFSLKFDKPDDMDDSLDF